jgi:hypothetical protein
MMIRTLNLSDGGNGSEEETVEMNNEEGKSSDSESTGPSTKVEHPLGHLQRSVPWLLVPLGVLLSVLLVAAIARLNLSDAPFGADFWQHYQAAGALLRGNPIPRPEGAFYLYPYPAFVPLLFMPFAALPSDLALLLWLSFLYGMTIYGVWQSTKVVSIPQGYRSLILMLAFLIWPGTLIALYLAQSTPLVLASLVSAYVLAEKGSKRKAGLCLSIGLIKPHLIAGVIIGLALKRQWKILSGFLAGGGLLGFLSLLAGQELSPIEWWNYLTSWFLAHRLNFSLLGQLWFLSWQVELLIFWLGAVILAYWWWRARVGRREVALGFLGSLAILPYFPMQDFMLLIPIYMLAFQEGGLPFWLALVFSSIGILRFDLGWLATLSIFLLGLSLCWKGRRKTGACADDG